MNIIQQAKHFAQVAHAGQKRKYTGEPYFYHPSRVAFWAASALGDPEVVAAALLHDTVEDTPATISQIQDKFGPRVGQLVTEVTDVSRPSDGNRKIRKALDRDHLAGASAEGQTIKLADLIDNSVTIAEYDPQFATVYMEEKRALLEVLTKGHPGLYAEAQRILRRFYRQSTATG